MAGERNFNASWTFRLATNDVATYIHCQQHVSKTFHSQLRSGNVPVLKGSLNACVLKLKAGIYNLTLKKNGGFGPCALNFTQRHFLFVLLTNKSIFVWVFYICPWNLILQCIHTASNMINKSPRVHITPFRNTLKLWQFDQQEFVPRQVCHSWTSPCQKASRDSAVLCFPTDMTIQRSKVFTFYLKDNSCCQYKSSAFHIQIHCVYSINHKECANWCGTLSTYHHFANLTIRTKYKLEPKHFCKH